jgi:hypothetical protein
MPNCAEYKSQLLQFSDEFRLCNEKLWLLTKIFGSTETSAQEELEGTVKC